MPRNSTRKEPIWNQSREKSFRNRVIVTLDAVFEQLNAGLIRLATDTSTLPSSRPWIVSINLNAL
jgi:hypothetical protein